MTLISNASNVLSASAFETDKICLMLVGSYNAANYNSILGGYLYQYNIPHNFGRPVFCDALFSNDSGTHYTPNGQLLNDLSAQLQIYSDSSNVYILNTNNTGIINYKIVGTWIDNYDTTNPLITPIFNTNSKAYYDSRINYQKILFNQKVNVANPGTGNTGNQTVFHSLGYTPNYKIYFESLAGQVWPSIQGGTQDIWLYDTVHQYEAYAKVDSTALYLSYLPSPSSAATLNIWYKVYYDGKV